MKASPQKNTKNTNILLYHLHTSSPNSVKIPACAWKILAIISLRCYYGNVCGNYVNTCYSRPYQIL